MKGFSCQNICWKFFSHTIHLWQITVLPFVTACEGGFKTAIVLGKIEVTKLLSMRRGTVINDNEDLITPKVDDL